MTFRCPSDAQARWLQKLTEHGEVIWLPVALGAYGRSFAALYVEIDDREANTSHLRHVAGCRREQIRLSTVRACERYGWTRVVDERVFASGLPVAGVFYATGHKPESVATTVLAMTDDGELALGLWAERKLSAPAPEVDPLVGRDREIVELAARAHAAGYALLPRTAEAQRESRRLARGPYARRGWGPGRGTRSLTATAIGEVEVLPDAADRPTMAR